MAASLDIEHYVPLIALDVYIMTYCTYSEPPVGDRNAPSNQAYLFGHDASIGFLILLKLQE